MLILALHLWLVPTAYFLGVAGWPLTHVVYMGNRCKTLLPALFWPILRALAWPVLIPFYWLINRLTR